MRCSKPGEQIQGDNVDRIMLRMKVELEGSEEGVQPQLFEGETVQQQRDACDVEGGYIMGVKKCTPSVV